MFIFARKELCSLQIAYLLNSLLTITVIDTYDSTRMKKISTALAAISYFATAAIVHAQSTVQIETKGLPGYKDISVFINAALRLVFVIALLGVLVMLVWGAVSWIISGGEKEAVGEARKRIVNALIGLVILAVAFAIANLAGSFVGVDLLGPLPIPGPNQPTPNLPVPSPAAR